MEELDAPVAYAMAKGLVYGDRSPPTVRATPDA
jgi:hypothetical protein